ncbi:MAG: hypothetical protein J6I49_03210 [Bacteroidales bacterium]|nr:hypothetical protein [Bacteroidales bacterium]
MARIDNNPLELKARLAAAGITLYIKNGRTILRPSRSDQPERRTRKQLAVRQRLAHGGHLWQTLRRAAEPLFAGGSSPYHRFKALNSLLETVYLTRDQHDGGATVLLPSMAVSDGGQEEIRYSLGEVFGRPALVTDLKSSALLRERYRFYLLRQEEVQKTPYVRITACEFGASDAAAVLGRMGVEVLDEGGCVALAGEVFADAMCGFALVRMCDGQASPQRVVTRSTYYQRFTTEAALLAAAKSYGGLTQ